MKSNNKILMTLLIIISLSIYSCGKSTEEDNYVTTELNGLYKYKSAYSTKDCNRDSKYNIDIRNELSQPYFIIEGEKGDFDGENNLLKYYCEDSNFNTCIRQDKFGQNIRLIIAKGSDGAWNFEDEINAKYDFIKKACVFTKSTVTNFTFEDEIMTVKTSFYQYEDNQISSSKCNLSSIEYSNFTCLVNKKYSMKREFLNKRDQEYFDNKEKQEGVQN